MQKSQLVDINYSNFKLTKHKLPLYPCLFLHMRCLFNFTGARTYKGFFDCYFILFYIALSAGLGYNISVILLSLITVESALEVSDGTTLIKTS